MTGVEILRHIIRASMHNKCRQTYRTTALARAAREIGAIFIVMTEGNRIELEDKFPGLDIRVATPSAIIGEIKPVIFDHLVLEQYLF